MNNKIDWEVGCHYKTKNGYTALLTSIIDDYIIMFVTLDGGVRTALVYNKNGQLDEPSDWDIATGLETLSNPNQLRFGFGDAATVVLNQGPTPSLGFELKFGDSYKLQDGRLVVIDVYSVGGLYGGFVSGYKEKQFFDPKTGRHEYASELDIVSEYIDETQACVKTTAKLSIDKSEKRREEAEARLLAKRRGQSIDWEAVVKARE